MFIIYIRPNVALTHRRICLRSNCVVQSMILNTKWKFVGDNVTLYLGIYGWKLGSAVILNYAIIFSSYSPHHIIVLYWKLTQNQSIYVSVTSNHNSSDSGQIFACEFVDLSVGSSN